MVMKRGPARQIGLRVHALRSWSATALIVGRTRLSTVRDRALPVYRFLLLVSGTVYPSTSLTCNCTFVACLSVAPGDSFLLGLYQDGHSNENVEN